MKLISMLTHPGVRAEPRAALVAGDFSCTRGEAVAAVAHMVEGLAEQGLRPGHRVLALIDHDSIGVFFLAAASAMGLRLLMPYNLQDGATSEWLNIVQSARPDFVVSLKRDPAHAAPLRGAGARVAELPFVHEAIATGPANRPVLIEAPDPIDNFIVLFTSGTTGAPKAISLSEAQVCERIRSVSSALAFGPDSRIFMSGLLNNTTGVIFSFGALLHDAVLVFPSGREIGSWPRQLADARATHVMLRPVAMQRFVDAIEREPVDLRALRVVAYGAAAMPRALLEKGRRLMPCDWMQGYGLSETFGPFCWLDEADHRGGVFRDHVYCVGRPDATMEVAVRAEGAIDGVGEVLVRGSGVMEGYCDVATGTVTPPPEWLPTGDLGTLTADGRLVLKGRIGNTVMSTNGHRIYPEEVEAVLAAIPGVAEALLLGVPGGESLISRPVACIHGPLSACDVGQIRHAVAEGLTRSLSREKWPEWIFASPTPFPKSANDKVLKAEVARLIDARDLIEV
jgi:acyl-CoA synthetase (AMP-forming)/AMP-acid ligase II